VIQPPQESRLLRSKSLMAGRLLSMLTLEIEEMQADWQVSGVVQCSSGEMENKQNVMSVCAMKCDDFLHSLQPIFKMKWAVCIARRAFPIQLTRMYNCHCIHMTMSAVKLV
jgi:hypothetical protein